MPGELVTFHLLFGDDGSAHGVAALFVYILILGRIDDFDPADDAATNMVDRLLRISTMFEEHGTGSARSHLIAQAARQNQAAAVLPVSTIQWLLMLREHRKADWGGVSTPGRSSLLKLMEEMINGYNSHPDVEAYATEPPAEKLKGRRKSAGAAAGDDDGADEA
jgi:hypothetical protein